MKLTKVFRVSGSAGIKLAEIAVAAGLFALGVEQSAMAQTPVSNQTQVNAGESALAAGDLKGALAQADAAIRTDPGRWEGYSLAGRALMMLKQYEPSADALSKAIERAPEEQQAMLRELRRRCLVAESATSSSATAPVESASFSQGAASPQSSSSATAVAHVSPSAISRRGRSELQNNSDASLWMDASTGLSWARPWYYPPDRANASWNFTEAQSFCAMLSLGGYSDWRLPSAEELQHVFPASGKWSWSNPKFASGFGIDDALERKQWRPAEFVLEGDRYEGNRLLLWTSTPSGKPGEHIGLYFGKSYRVKDEQRMGMSFEGSRLRTPFHGYALCVRSAQ